LFILILAVWTSFGHGETAPGVKFYRYSGEGRRLRIYIINAAGELVRSSPRGSDLLSVIISANSGKFSGDGKNGDREKGR